MITTSFESQFSEVLRQKLGEAVDEKKTHIAAGVPQTYADFRERVGEVKGLIIALDILDEINKSIAGESRT